MVSNKIQIQLAMQKSKNIGKRRTPGVIVVPEE